MPPIYSKRCIELSRMVPKMMKEMFYIGHFKCERKGCYSEDYYPYWRGKGIFYQSKMSKERLRDFSA